MIEKLIALQASIERRYLRVAKKYFKVYNTHAVELDEMSFYVIDDFNPLTINVVTGKYFYLADVLPYIAIFPNKQSLESMDVDKAQRVNLGLVENLRSAIALTEALEGRLQCDNV